MHEGATGVSGRVRACTRWQLAYPEGVRACTRWQLAYPEGVRACTRWQLAYPEGVRACGNRVLRGRAGWRGCRSGHALHPAGQRRDSKARFQEGEAALASRSGCRSAARTARGQANGADQAKSTPFALVFIFWPNAKLSYPERAHKLRVKGEREAAMSKKNRAVAARG